MLLVLQVLPVLLLRCCCWVRLFVAVRDCGLLPLIIASRGTHINLGV